MYLSTKSFNYAQTPFTSGHKCIEIFFFPLMGRNSLEVCPTILDTLCIKENLSDKHDTEYYG
jgi:hypothetical protein